MIEREYSSASMSASLEVSDLWLGNKWWLDARDTGVGVGATPSYQNCLADNR
jgi:hypothetical protein